MAILQETVEPEMQGRGFGFVAVVLAVPSARRSLAAVARPAQSAEAVHEAAG